MQVLAYVAEGRGRDGNHAGILPFPGQEIGLVGVPESLREIALGYIRHGQGMVQQHFPVRAAGNLRKLEQRIDAGDHGRFAVALGVFNQGIPIDGLGKEIVIPLFPGYAVQGGQGFLALFPLAIEIVLDKLHDGIRFLFGLAVSGGKEGADSGLNGK